MAVLTYGGGVMRAILAVLLVVGMSAVASAQTYTVTISGVTEPTQNRFPASAINGAFTCKDLAGGGICFTGTRISPIKTAVGNFRATCFLESESLRNGSAIVRVRVSIGAGAVGEDGQITYQKVVSEPVDFSGMTIPFSGILNNAIGLPTGYTGSQARIN